MAVAVNESLQQLKQLDEKISAFSSILSLAGWDQKVKAPKKGRSTFAKSMGAVSTEVFKMSISPELGEALEELTKPEVYETLDEKDQALVRDYNHNYTRSKSIPTDLFQEYSVLTGEANQAWEEARANNDFASYQPYLEKMVDFKRKFAEYYGYEDHPYDALMDAFEPGLKVKDIDPIFRDLRESSINLLERIQNSGTKMDRSFLEKNYDTKTQEEFLHNLLPKLGYDTEAGRLDATAHPFAQKVNIGDVRITTRYDEDNLSFALFSTIHEVGHALYEQGVREDLEGTGLNGGTSLGIHESQSRFLENMVGRTPEFWQAHYSDLQETFPEQLKDVSREDFYHAVNSVQPSFIRVEADELTYNLHIMIRYEIEKGLIAGDIEVKDLPRVWNEKMEEYLGIVPDNDSVGVLQDVHWSFGAIGYFHTYSLGNLYSAQILNTIQKEIPGFYEQIAQGDLTQIREWLREKIHQHGSIYQPSQLIEMVTGEKLNSDYLVNYLEEKYSKLYNLK
ncbi:carboxypeptidase M32 [Pontibacillus marinus]|uniref:Metal-dependent carboxypeptidase n=1 Tax=Pontibacillus marinus BH030004 = DSM 16465 TaxID=1385511 RepID=A0A0A5GHV0_9BACI|nr:carboxypeptidase M32 [Pontibacillus marinus]KGX90803.1 peptidase M32 [Pontibacillus marinus BH030004 = DSM 16465]